MSKQTSTRVLLPSTLVALAKRVFVVFALLVTLTSVYSITRASVPVAEAAAPTTLNFQARLLNTSGSLVSDGDYNVEFKIYNANSSSGSSQGACTGDANCLWTETRTGVNKIRVKNGYLSAYLGDITALPTNIWNQQLYLTMNIGGTGAASWDGEMTPRIRLTSVPYAFRATIAESAETLSKNTGSFTGTVDFSTMTANRTFLLPDTSLATTASPGTICVFNGTASNCPAATGSAYYIQNTGGSATPQTAANFNIQATNSGTDGTVAGILRGAAGGQTVDLLQFQATNGSVLGAVTAAGNLLVASSIDTYAAGTLSVGNSTATAVSICNSASCDTISVGTNADADTINIGDSLDTLSFTGAAINLVGDTAINGNVTVAAGKYLSLAGGNTASRPASPTEGMLYYDTSTKQLLVYANGKWQADRSTATKIVAASNSSQAVKDAADYVADGTGDQTEINAALTAAAGGKVYLAEGTYVANATILIPNNTVLSGAGRGSVIELADLDVTDNLIENSDTSTGTGVRIQDLRIDGRNDLNTAGTQYGIYFNGMGGGAGVSARQGGIISGVTANNFRSYGIFLTASPNNIITGNRAQNNTGGGFGLDAGSHFNTVTGNSVQGSSLGIVVATGGNAITGNTFQGHTNTGIYLIGGLHNSITGNAVSTNVVTGIALTAGSNLNTVTGNKFYDNGGATTNNAIYITGSDSNTISANNINDSAATTNNYAINIFDSTSDTNHLSNNLLGAGSISDAGTGTVYSGQINGSGNYMVQPAGTIELMKNTNVTGTLAATVALQAPLLDTATAVALSIGTTNATNITIGHNAGTLAVDQTNFDLSTAGVITLAGGQAADITTQANQSLTIQANGTGVISLNDSITAGGTLTFNGVATDITTSTNQDLTVVANGTGTIVLNDTVTAAGTITISGVATDITTAANEDLTVEANGTGIINLNDTVSVAGNFTVTNAGNVAFQRNTTNYTATGTQNDIDFGTGVLFRITSASALTITSIAGGVDGRIITLANASSNALTINNDSGGTAANRIITGTGTSLSIPAGATVQLAYDSGSSRWRVFGGTATSGGGANQQLSNLSGTVAVNTSLNPYDTNVIDLGSSNYSWRTLYADTSVLTPRVDTDGSATLLLGDTNATAITLGRTGITTTNAGAFTVSQLLTANAGITVSGGAISLTGNAASSLTTSSGALTITSAAAATWSTSAGNLTVDSAAALNLGTTNATSVSISKAGVTTTVNGALTVTQAGTFNGGLTAASDFTVTNAGNIAFQRNTTDYASTGTQNDIDFGTGALFRITSASALTITSIAGGVDGRIITLANASSNAVTINNDSGGTAANRIITGTGTSLSVPAGSTVQLTYDNSSSRWRVIGGTATSGGGANQQLSNLSGTIAINASLTPNADNTLDLGSSASSWKTLYADTSILSPRLDTDSATTLNIGNTTAAAITIGRTGITTTNAGALTVSQLLTGNAGATISGGAISLTGNAASSLTTSSGALTITSAAAAVWSTTAGNLTVDSAAALNLGTTNATSVSISKTGVTTTVNGALTVTQAGQFNGGLTVASDLTVTNAGNVAFQRNTTDYTGVGAQSDINFGTGVLFRITSASALTINSVAGGVDGRILTLVNASSNAVTIANETGATAANRILTGTGGITLIPVDGTIQLAYDSSASRWRVLGGTATSGGGANQQLSNLSGTIAINASLTPNATNSLDLGSTGSSWRTLYADTSVLAPRLDTDGGATLLLGDTNASAITLGRTGITTTNAGALTVSQLLTANAGITASGGALSLAGNAASSLTTSAGALTITSAAAATWSTSAGNLTVDSAAALNLGTSNATSVSISKTGVTTTVNGALTVTQAGQFNGGLTVASDLTVTNAGNVAFQRNTTDFTATGVQDDVNLGTGALFRLNGATTQTITSIQGGVDGRVITLINAGANAATIQNDSGGTAANRIITGTGGNLSVPAGASIQLAYDSSASRWRIIGGSAVAGGGANQQLSNLSGTVAINQSLTPNATNTLDLGSSANSWRTIYADTSVLTPRVDTDGAATLLLGDTNATAITLGRSGITTTNAGALTVTQLLTGNAGATISGGALSLTGNAASSLTTSSGALTITSAAAATWSTSAGNLTVDSAAALNLGTTNATSLSISKTGVTTTVNGALTVTEAGTFNGGLTVASNLTVTPAGNVAFQRNTTDFTTTGTSNDVDLGTGVLFRINGATAQTITSITGGVDGRVITLINAGANAATIQNDSGGTAANRIITGTGGNLSVPSGATIQLAYDSSASRWRIIGGSATSGGGANQQLSNLSGTVAVNANLTPTGDNGIDLGSSGNSWRTLYADTSVLTPTVDTATATTLNLGTTTANAVSISRTGVTTTVNGALTVTEAGQFNGGLTVASNLTVTQAGNVAFQRNTTNYSSTGTQNDINFGTGALFRIISASALTITSIAGGADGRVITLINASANPVTITNNSGGTATNRIITGTGANITIPAGASLTLAYDSADTRWRVIGSTAAANGYIQLQSSSPGTAQTGNFNISGNGYAEAFYATEMYVTDIIYSPVFDSLTSLNLGTVDALSILIGSTSNGQSIRIGQEVGTIQLDGTNFDLATTGVVTLAGNQTRDITTAAANTAAGLTIKPGNSTGSNVQGATLTLQGGTATAGNANGGAVTIAGGAGFGTGTQGLVNLSTTAFTSSTVQTYSVAGVNSIAAGLVDQYSTIPVNTTTTGVIVSVPDPAQNTIIGRVLYISARDNALDFTLRLNASGTAIDIAMKENSTATLIWNGDEWTAAGASSSTDLQSAYNNTLTSAGGAEIVLNPTGGAADGFTIRNNGTTPIVGGLLEVQSSVGTNLFSVNNRGSELAANGGAETSSTFATNWTAAPAGGTVTRHTTTGQYVTGQAGVQVATTAANHGVRNNLVSNPTVSTTFTVSFTVKSSVAISSSNLNVQYSRDGGTDLEACTNYSTQNVSITTWTKITCTITTDSTTATNPDLIIRQADGTSRNIWIDNLSFMRNDNTTQPSNVQIGGGNDGGPITLFTLDRASAPPVAAGDETYYGSMYYDTITGSIQCYEADGWGACGSPPDNIITLTPEYTGAVLNGNGVGVMTADFCANQVGVLQVNHTTLCTTSGEARNYYRWTSPQATLQTYSIYVTYKLPTTFKQFASSSTMKLTAYRDDPDDADARVVMTTYRKNSAGGVTLCGTATDITNSEDTWEPTAVDGDENSCSFAGGDYIIFKITMESRNNTNVYVENLDFTYVNK